MPWDRALELTEDELFVASDLEPPESLTYEDVIRAARAKIDEAGEMLLECASGQASNDIRANPFWQSLMVDSTAA